MLWRTPLSDMKRNRRQRGLTMSDRRMRILALTPAPYDTSPALRFRLEQWARYLEADGVHFTFVPFEDERLHAAIYEPGQYLRKAFHIGRALRRRLSLLP